MTLGQFRESVTKVLQGLGEETGNGDTAPQTLVTACICDCP